MVLNATFNKMRYGLKFYIVIPLSVYKYDLCMVLNWYTNSENISIVVYPFIFIYMFVCSIYIDFYEI